MYLTESQLRAIISNAVRNVLNEGSIIDNPLDAQLRLAAKECQKRLSDFNPDAVTLNADDVEGYVDDWVREEDENGYVKFYTTVKVDNLPLIVLIRDAYAFKVKGAYNQDSNELWIVCRGNESEGRIYSTMYHEMIHYVDDTRYGILGRGYQDDDELPDCFNRIFYILWNKNKILGYQGFTKKVKKSLKKTTKNAVFRLFKINLNNSRYKQGK